METEDITEFEPFKKYSLKDTPPPLFERVLFIWSDGLFYTGELMAVLNDSTLQIYNDKLGSNVTHNRGYWMRIVTDLEPRLCTLNERKFLDEIRKKAGWVNSPGHALGLDLGFTVLDQKYFESDLSKFVGESLDIEDVPPLPCPGTVE